MVLSMLLVVPAVAATSDEAVHAAVASAYGREVPAAAVCVARPPLGEGFAGDVVVAGVTQGTIGCQALGVLVAGAWHPTEAALPAARTDAITEPAIGTWVRHVLLAFDQPLGEVEVASDTGVYAASVPFLRRVAEGDRRHLVEQVEGRFTFDDAGHLTATAHESGPRWQTRFSTQEIAGGGLSPERVVGALEQRGRLVAACWEAAFTRDLTLDGRILMQWTLKGGQAVGISWVDEGRPVDEEQARCYADALRHKPFPPDMNGTVQWAFRTPRVAL